MHGLILAGFCLAVYAAGCSIGLRLYSKNREYRVLMLVLTAAATLYVILFQVLPENLGFLPAGTLEPCREMDFVNGLIALVVPAQTFWSYLYSTGTGPSSNMLVALHQAGEKGRSFEELYNLYQRPGEVDLIFARRMPKLVEDGYLEKLETGYRMLPRARKFAWMASALKRIFNTGPAG